MGRQIRTRSENIMTSTARKETIPSTLTDQELEQARLFLQQTQNAVIGATKGLTASQWRFRPAPGQWTIAEILDHVVAAQERIFGPMLGSLTPNTTVRDYKAVDHLAIHQFPTRLVKFPAPDFFQPKDPAAPAELIERMKANSDRFLHYLVSTPHARQLTGESAPLKAVSGGAYDTMDAYQWVLTAAAHTERHAKQMLEVIADDRFPA